MMRLIKVDRGYYNAGFLLSVEAWETVSEHYIRFSFNAQVFRSVLEKETNSFCIDQSFTSKVTRDKRLEEIIGQFGEEIIRL